MLNRDASTPLYIQFCNLLKEEMERFPAGTYLPSERALCEKYGVDRVTVRKALSILADENLIERKQGRGTRVLRHASEPGGKSTVLFALYHGTSLVDRMGEPFYGRSLDALERYYHRQNVRLLYSKVRGGDRLDELCDRLEAAGLILAGTLDEDIRKQCAALRVPVVIFNRSEDGLPSVFANGGQGANLAAEHLLGLGHTRIGFLHVPGYANSDERLEAFRRALQRHGIPQEALAVEVGNWTEQSGFSAAQKLLERAPRITAIFGGNDSMALGAMRACQEAGKGVPRDISIIGYDGLPQSASSVPALTTVEVDVEAMAEAADMLLSHLRVEGAHRNINAAVTPHLVARKSTARNTEED